MLWANNKLRLLVIGACNTHCPHCHNEGVADNAPPMPLGLVKVVTATAQAVGEFPVSTTLSGGEPLLHPELESLLAEVSKISRSITLSTNGFLLDKAKVCKLATAGVMKIRIDLDPWRFERSSGPERSLNTTRVAELVSLVRSAGVAVAFNTVLTSYTPAQLESLLRFSHNLNVNTKCFERLLKERQSRKYVAAPDIPFKQLQAALAQVLPGVEWVRDPVAGGDRTAECSGFTLRYCRALCSAGACFYSGLRCDPLGHLSTCINGFDTLLISESDDPSTTAEKIRHASLRGCCT
jgi:MoaA/NifB/PqqE/SkfB family radical SAM enzyme